MNTLNMRELINLAIGSPEPGHVNFCALHCLLSHIAEKLNMTEDKVDYSQYESTSLMACGRESYHEISKTNASRGRLTGGTDFNEIEKGTTGETENTKQNDHDTYIEQDVATTELESTRGNGSEHEFPLKDVANTMPSAADKMRTDTSKWLEKSENENKVSIRQLESRIVAVETQLQQNTVNIDVIEDVSVMKEQLELMMEQLQLLALVTMNKEIKPWHLLQIQKFSLLLNGLRKGNTNSFELSHLKVTGDSPTSVLESEHKDGQSNCDVEAMASNQYDLDLHLCYSPEKMLDQLLKLKADFCLIVNQVHDISAKLLQQENQHTLIIIQDLQEQMRDVKVTAINLKEQQDRMETRITNNLLSIVKIKKSLDEIITEKINKSEIDILLADKVNYNQLQRKVSFDQILEMQCRSDKKFSEVLKQINNNEKRNNDLIEHLNTTLGFAAIESVLNNFKVEIEKKMCNLQEMLQKYIDSTDDEWSAAGARVKVLQDLVCLSCDTPGVMRTVEKAKVAKFPSTYTSPTLSPLITYKLGSIRKSGVMRYYRKD